MKREVELRILEVDRSELTSKLSKADFIYMGKLNQRRFVYDFNPVNPNKWIRLRTNGVETCLTIKEIVDNTKVDGTKEWEIKVSDMNETNEILKELGYTPRNYQENNRTIYRKEGIEVVIDEWPLIPTYCEIEADNEELIDKTLTELNINKSNTTTLDVASIYNKYGIDIKSIKELKFC